MEGWKDGPDGWTGWMDVYIYGWIPDTGWMPDRMPDRMDACCRMDGWMPEDRKTGRPEDIGIKKDAYESAPILIDPYLLWSNFKYTPT